MPLIKTKIAEDQLNLTISWGEIQGDIINQTDLNTILNSKADIDHIHDNLPLPEDIVIKSIYVDNLDIGGTPILPIAIGDGTTGLNVPTSGRLEMWVNNELKGYFDDDELNIYFPIKINGNTVWHTGNDGTNSGLDADLLDGKDSTYFATATDLSTHISNTSNPHNVTAAQVNAYPLGSVVADSDKLDGFDGSYYLNWSNLTNKPSTISGYGITDALSVEALNTHAATTTNVHGIVDTSDLALKSAGIAQFGDVNFDVDSINQAVTKMHDQNTDVGTSSTSFYIGPNGPRIKNNANVFELRNNADTAYADLVVNNLTIKGTTTTINSETLTIDDNIIVLNNNYTGSSPTENGGVEVERGTQTNATILWDESLDKWRAGLVGAQKTIVTEGNTITLTSGATGTGTVDSNGNASIAVTITNNSHTHTIANVTNLQSTLDSKVNVSDYTGANILSKLITVDGVNSGLDADLLDGNDSTYYLHTVSQDTAPALGGTLNAGLHSIVFTQKNNTSVSGNAVIDWNTSNKQSITLTENTTISFINPDGACNLILQIKQDANGPWTVTLPNNILTVGGEPLTFTIVAGAMDLLMLYFDGTEYIASVMNDIRPIAIE